MIRMVQNGRFNSGSSNSTRTQYGNTVNGVTHANMAYKANLWNGWSKRIWSEERRQWVFWSPADSVWYKRRPIEDAGLVRLIMVPLDNRVNPDWTGVKIPNNPDGTLPTDAAKLRITRVNNAPIVAGEPFEINVFNDTNSSIEGATVVFGSTDPLGTVPAPAYFGVLMSRNGNVTLRTAGAQTITISNGINSATLVVNVLASNFVVTGTNNGTPLTTNAGANISITVTVMNGLAVDAAYRGTVHFTSGDDDAVLPADYEFVAGDAGVKVFNGVQLKRIYGAVPTQTITVTDGGTNIGRITYTIVPGNATTINITPMLPGSDFANDIQTSGAAFPIRVYAADAFSNIAKSFRGTVRFTSNDGGATLPGNYQFTAADNGSHQFNVTLSTVRENVTTITVHDNANVLAAEDSIPFMVRGACASIEVTYNQPIHQDDVFALTLRAKDSNGRMTPVYGGTLFCSKSNYDVEDQFPTEFPFQPRRIAFGAGLSVGMQYTVAFHSNGTLQFTDTGDDAVYGSTYISLIV